MIKNDVLLLIVQIHALWAYAFQRGMEEDSCSGYDPSMNLQTKKALLEIHVGTFITGTVALFGKFLTIPPLLIVWYRVLFAATALALYLFSTGEPLRVKSTRDALTFIFLGGLLAAHWGSFFQSVQISTVAIASLTFGCFPVFVAILEPIFFREKYRYDHVMAAVMVFAGIALITPSLELSDRFTQGVLWGLFSAFSFAILSICNRKLLARYSGTEIEFFQTLVASLLLLPIAFIRIPLTQPMDLLLVAILGIVHTALAHTLLIRGMSVVTARTMSIIASLESIYAILLAIVIIGEIPSGRTIAGGFLVLLTAAHTTLKANTLAKN